jgi:hypothetical protein
LGEAVDNGASYLIDSFSYKRGNNLIDLKVFLSSFIGVDKDIDIGIGKNAEALANELNDFVIFLIDFFDLAVD